MAEIGDFDSIFETSQSAAKHVDLFSRTESLALDDFRRCIFWVTGPSVRQSEVQQ